MKGAGGGELLPCRTGRRSGAGSQRSGSASAVPRRRASLRVVRRLHSYYGRVRLLVPVHHRLRFLTLESGPPRDVTAGYVQMTVEALREPAQRAAEKMKALCGIEPPRGENVVGMTRPG
jgi:hypothetical protein